MNESNLSALNPFAPYSNGEIIGGTDSLNHSQDIAENPLNALTMSKSLQNFLKKENKLTTKKKSLKKEIENKLSKTIDKISDKTPNFTKKPAASKGNSCNFEGHDDIIHYSSTKDYKLNNMFKIINFLEKDEALTKKRNQIREKLKQFKKVAYSTINYTARKIMAEDYNDHQRIKNFRIGKVLGEGSYAVVRYAVSKEDGKKVAIKIYDKMKNFDSIKKSNLKSEIDILNRMDNENIIKLYETFEGTRYIYLVLEYIGPISLYDYMESKPHHKIREDEARHVFYQVLKALKYIHDSGFVHRDVKLHNILVGSKGQVK